MTDTDKRLEEIEGIKWRLERELKISKPRDTLEIRERQFLLAEVDRLRAEANEYMAALAKARGLAQEHQSKRDVTHVRELERVETLAQAAGIDVEDLDGWVENTVDGMAQILARRIDALRADLSLLQSDYRDQMEDVKRLRAEAKAARDMCAEQAEDDGLWCIAETGMEEYLQAALRKLHAAIECQTPLERIRALIQEKKADEEDVGTLITEGPYGGCRTKDCTASDGRDVMTEGK